MKVTFSWWFIYLYLPGLQFMNSIVVNYINIDAKPNQEKLDKMIRRAAKFEIVKNK